MKNSGVFITFEGADGVGKSTQVALLHKSLLKRGYSVVLTREPGGGKFAESVREILLNPKTKIEPLTELFLYEVARIEHLNKVILPALRQKKIVLCDRFTDATLAYQGYGRGLLKESMALNKLATQGLKPDITILLDLPTRQSFAKARKRSGVKKLDRLEQEGESFQAKVRRGYMLNAKKEPSRVKIISVCSTIEETQNKIQLLIMKKINEHYRPK